MLDGQNILLVGSLQLLQMAFQIGYLLQALLQHLLCNIFLVVANQKAFDMLPTIWAKSLEWNKWSSKDYMKIESLF
jgi:hypothetical protein